MFSGNFGVNRKIVTHNTFVFLNEFFVNKGKEIKSFNYLTRLVVQIVVFYCNTSRMFDANKVPCAISLNSAIIFKPKILGKSSEPTMLS